MRQYQITLMYERLVRARRLIMDLTPENCGPKSRQLYALLGDILNDAPRPPELDIEGARQSLERVRTLFRLPPAGNFKTLETFIDDTERALHS